MLDRLSEYISQRKGLLPMVGLLLVAANYALQFLPLSGGLVSSNLLLHLGVIVAIVGLMLARAL